ncbi:MAG: glycoside hydrolase family 32 protein [Chitinophagaceae bacterium]
MYKYNTIYGALLFAVSVLCCSCKKENASYNADDLTNPKSIFPAPPTQWLSFAGTTYYSSGYVGDVMPYYDNGTFHVFYLHDGDAASDADGGGFHPIHALETSDLLTYSYDGKMINYSSTADQDMALGTGSVVKVGSTYYFYYTGHNGTATWIASNPAETVKYATSTDLKNWTKNEDFSLTPPTGYGTSDFRDPFVFYNDEDGQYWMLVTAKYGDNAVVTLFKSTDPSTDEWTLSGPIYTASSSVTGMLECPDMFKMGSTWYMVYSDQESSTVKYLTASSASGPFTAPTQNTLDGGYFYGARTQSDGSNRYLFGWNYRKDGSTDYGSKTWAGNLIVHQLVQNSDGTLATTTPQVQSELLSKSATLEQVDATSASNSGSDYTLQSAGAVHFDRISGQKRIAATISGLTDSDDAGFVFGWARPDNTDYYKIRFQSGAATIAKVQSDAEYVDATIPYTASTSGDITVEIVIDNTSFVVHINGVTSLTGRSYWLPNAQWGLYSVGGSVTFKALGLYGY